MNYRKLRSPHLLAGVALALFGMQAAAADPGGHAAGMAGMHDAMPAFAFGHAAAPQKADRTVRIVMKDLSFAPDAVTVGAGETVRFVVTNAGELEHDFTIGDAATQIAHRKEMAEMFAQGGTMQHAGDPNAIALQPGQTGELTWTFAGAGRLEFDCNVPGHYEGGMTGTIVVKR